MLPELPTCEYTIDQIVDLDQIKGILELHSRLSGIACGLMDNDEGVLVAVGLQEVCTQYHWKIPEGFARCWRSDPEIRRQLHAFTGDLFECRCKNGMVNIAMPVIIDGKRLATFFAGQFFYDDTPPDLALFRRQAEELGFDTDAYLASVRKAPLFDRTHVDSTMRLLYHIVQLLVDAGVKNRLLAFEIKQHKEAEKRRALKNFALDHVREAAFLIDDQGRFLYVNREACHSLGYDRETLLGLAIPDINPDFSPERRANSYSHLLEHGSHTFETRHRTSQGHLFPVEISSTVLDYGGEKFTLALARDITFRKRTEEALCAREREFRSLAENIPDNIARHDRDGHILYVNPSLENTIGTPLAKLQGKSPREWQPGSWFAKYNATLDRVIATGMGTVLELPIPGENGTTTYHQINFVPEQDPTGAFTSILAIGRDITEVKRSAQRLIDNQKHLSDLALELSMAEERERRRIATDLHDTLGQDLTLARIKMGVLSKSPLTEDQSSAIGDVRTLLENAINRVRRLTRLICPPIMESAGLEAALKWLGRQISASYNLQIEFNDDLQDKEIPCEYQMELYNSVRELLINVAKHAGADAARLSVTREAAMFVVRVVDDGVGFDVDFALDHPAAEGFGLINIKRRITHMGGLFEIDSGPGHGSRVTIGIPLKEPGQKGAKAQGNPS